MTHKERLELAAAAHAAKRKDTHYVVTWRGGGEQEIYSGPEGFNNVAALLNVTGGTLYNYLSRGRGTCSFKGTNSTTGIEDIGTVSRILPPFKQKRPVGRPKRIIDWDRLGSEAPGNPDVPKTRNRRRRGKP